MNWFQILAVLVAVFFIARTLWRTAKRRIAPLPGLAWTIVWLAAAGTILRPEVTVVPAQLLGIQRGADLVFYLAILAGLAGFYALFTRLRQIDQAITQLTRRLALAEADDGQVRPGPEAAADDSAGRGR